MDSTHIATLIGPIACDIVPPTMASSNRSRLFWSGLWIYSIATGLASMLFMALAFYTEATGNGIRFIEPNRLLAAGELATVTTGMMALLILFFRSLSLKE